MTPTDAIREFLDRLEISYRYLEHVATRTSEESATVRGEPLEIGAKAMVLKVDDDYRLFVLSAARKLDSRAIKQRLGARSLRFATADELMASTGLVPGSVPPFGQPILPFALALDTNVQQLDRVAFNAGSLTASIIMRTSDYQRAAQPEQVFPFSR